MKYTVRSAAIVLGAVASVMTVITPGMATASSAHADAPIARAACGAVPAGFARCFALVRTDVHGGLGVRGPAADRSAAQVKLPVGYGPADLRAAYDLPTAGGSGQTVAIVDAGDDAHAEADLAVYRKTYGLPACTTANRCFRKVNQAGRPSPRSADQGWGVEIALDLDMVSAACPHCKILLVEGDDASFVSLSTAENTAAALGANEISNSYGGTESGQVLSYGADYAHPGVAITVSSGDFGYGPPNFPAALSSVIAVGGTSLTKAGNARGWTESAWNSAGGAAASGCSAWVDKPAWQHDPNCPGRMVADVSADADPLTGPAFYGTVDGPTGWGVAGGTSAAAPFLAGVIGLAGNPARYPNASYFYSHTSELNDVTKGTNVIGEECGGDYQCKAAPRYDGPTGLGTPKGIGAF